MRDASHHLVPGAWDVLNIITPWFICVPVTPKTAPGKLILAALDALMGALKSLIHSIVVGHL